MRTQHQPLLQSYDEQQQLTTIALENARAIQDNNWSNSVALPAAAASAVYTASFNLIESMAMSEHYAVQVDVPTIGTQLGAAYTLTVELQGSADNVTFTRVLEAADIVLTGDAATPSSVQFRLSTDCPQYIRTAFTTGATIVSTLAGYSGTMSLRF